jgi:hypothetical protein
MQPPDDKAESQEFGNDLADVIDSFAAGLGVTREEAARKLLAEAQRHGQKELADILDRIVRRLAGGRN